MRCRKWMTPIVMVVIIILFFCVNYTYSQLSPVKRKELMIAYMNGYYEALQLDIAELEKLKADNQVLKQKVMAAGEKYGTIIDIMNKSSSD